VKNDLLLLRISMNSDLLLSKYEKIEYHINQFINLLY